MRLEARVLGLVSNRDILLYNSLSGRLFVKKEAILKVSNNKVLMNCTQLTTMLTMIIMETVV